MGTLFSFPFLSFLFPLDVEGRSPGWMEDGREAFSGLGSSARKTDPDSSFGAQYGTGGNDAAKQASKQWRGRSRRMSWCVWAVASCRGGGGREGMCNAQNGAEAPTVTKDIRMAGQDSLLRKVALLDARDEQGPNGSQRGKEKTGTYRMPMRWTSCGDVDASRSSRPDSDASHKVAMRKEGRVWSGNPTVPTLPT
ncbi:hypothetical protein LX32DRAFT_454421 [Colletotrichum zoysiae]|uniref:Secreted protein n=1 Tax=Colletotrichum zoysiae TaxID=1216348 RepID=A0AAD9M376_9PEZI|nr:hypothetical protein LX32DRAFT_454421 [Colletotrichum zoysiae]